MAGDLSGCFWSCFHFAVPFVLLLSRPFKRDITTLVWLAVWLLFMRYLDLFWIIEPNFSKTLSLTLLGSLCSDRHRRPVAGVLLPQPEFAAAAAGV